VRSTATDLALYRRLLRQARPYWPHLGGILALSLLAPPLALLVPLPLQIAVDSVIGSHPLPGVLDALLPDATTRSPSAALFLAAGLAVVVALLVHAQALGSWLLQTYTGERLVLDFRGQLFAHVQRLSLSYHDTKGTTDSTYRSSTMRPPSSGSSSTGSPRSSARHSPSSGWSTSRRRSTGSSR